MRHILFCMGSSEDVEYILSTFQGIVKEDEAHGGMGETRRRVMEAFEELGGNRTGVDEDRGLEWKTASRFD